MRTFLAFRLKHETTDEELNINAKRLADYYQNSYLNYSLEYEYSFHKNTGSIILDDVNSPHNFSSMIRNNHKEVTTYFPPLEVVDTKYTMDEKLQLIIDGLWENPEEISNYSSPFLFSVLNYTEEKMVIYNDGMALNRLYILETENGVYWSNRPSALLIFSETKAELDLESWKIYATSGWFVNETSPFKNIKRVRPGILYEINISDDQFYRIKETKSINNLISLEANKEIDYNHVANDMKREIESFNHLWKINPEIDLSGGVDSRVSASNVLYSNIEEFEFRSIEDIKAEVSKAKHLLEIQNEDKKINVINPLDYIEQQEPLFERVKKILFEFDGDFATVMINSPIVENNNFQTLKNTQVFGFGGEIAKGAFYSNQRWLDKLEKYGSEAAFYRLSTHFVKVGCTSTEAINLMKEEFDKVLNVAESYNFNYLKKLDFFYFHERFRRWTPSGDRVNFYSPFYNKRFISIGLNNDPLENINYSTHKNLIHQMTPKWDDISFFKATPDQSKEKDKKNLRLWQTKDKVSIEQILEDSETWNDVFIVEDVKSIWEKAKSEGIPNFQETLFQRVILRSLFNKHINFINRHLYS